MSWTAQQIYEMAIDLIDERESTGVIDAAKTREYLNKAPSLLTLWQSEIAKSGDFYKTKEISRKPITNMLGYTNGFDIQEHVDTDKSFECSGSAKAYHFEVDGPGTVYIEDYTNGWNTLATVTVPDTVTYFTAYKGVVTPTSGATKSRLRFSGSYFYRCVNRALFSQPFQADRVPDYQPWIKYDMPSDFKSVDAVITEFPDRQYAKDANYKLEGKDDFYINYYFEGKIRIVYKPVPVKITAMTQTLEIDDITAISGSYYLAMHFVAVEQNEELRRFFKGKYDELKMESMIKQPLGVQQIIDIYGIADEG